MSAVIGTASAGDRRKGVAFRALVHHPVEARLPRRVLLGMALAAGRRADALHLRLAKYIAKRMARRYAARLVPFIGAPIGAIQNGSATKQLGQRSLQYYARP